VVRILATHYVETAIRSRLFAFLVLAWVVVILGGATINSCVARQASLSRGAEATARAAYYAEIPNRRLLFQNFYTLRRPSAPLAPMATGVEYLAATYIDYRPRFSPTFYYGDDLNPLMRFCKSPHFHRLCRDTPRFRETSAAE